MSRLQLFCDIVKACNFKRDRLWVRFSLEKMKYLIFLFFARVSKQNPELSFNSQHGMPPEFNGKWEGECLNTRLPPPNLLAGYSVKLIHLNNEYINKSIKQ